MDIEQQPTEATEQQTEAPTEATREDLLTVAREAAAGVEGAETAPKEEPPAEQAPVVEEPKIHALLKAREKAQAERAEARNHAQEILEEARRQAQQTLEEARTKAAEAWDAEITKRRQQFEASPTESIRQLTGGDPQQVVDAVLRDGTPEGRAMRALQEEIRSLKPAAQVAETAKQEIERLRAEVQQQERARQVAEVRATFLGQHATPEKVPYAHTEYGGADGVFARANAKALEWREQGLVLGKDFDFADVASYVEHEAKEVFQRKLQALGITPAQQSGAGAPAREPGIAPKSAANGSRTITAASGSERRASPKAFHEMNPVEQREDLMNEVRKVYRQFGKT